MVLPKSMAPPLAKAEVGQPSPNSAVQLAKATAAPSKASCDVQSVKAAFPVSMVREALAQEADLSANDDGWHQVYGSYTMSDMNTRTFCVYEDHDPTNVVGMTASMVRKA